MKHFIRLVLKKLHVWVGLGFGILFCLMGLSGSIIVFRAQIEDILRPKWQSTGQIPTMAVVDAAVANTHEKWPEAQITRIGFPNGLEDPYRLLLVDGTRQLHVFCDSRTGAVLGTFDLPWLNSVVDFHHNLLMAKSGRRLTGIIGMALFTVALSGVLIWLLRKPALSDIGRVSFGAPWKRVNFELHRSTGLMVNAFLLLISFTGMWMAYPDTFRGAVQALSGAPAAKAPKLKVKDATLAQPVDAYVQAALHAMPGTVLKELRLPQGPKAPVTAKLWQSGDLRPDGSSQVILDPATAHVLSADNAAVWPISKRIAEGATPVHYAEWGGLPLRIFWCLLGLTPSGLFISGLLIWSGRWLPARLRKRTKAGELVAAESLT